MTKSNIARTWRKKHPDMPTRKLARIIYNDNKLTFKDVEDARKSVRYIEGKSGDTNRKSVAKSEFFGNYIHLRP